MSKIRQWVESHTGLAMWAVLAAGMVLILLWTARDVGLEPSQWFWLIVITTLVAGLCVWIITWGDDDDEAEALEPDAAQGGNSAGGSSAGGKTTNE